MAGAAPAPLGAEVLGVVVLGAKVAGNVAALEGEPAAVAGNVAALEGEPAAVAAAAALDGPDPRAAACRTRRGFPKVGEGCCLPARAFLWSRDDLGSKLALGDDAADACPGDAAAAAASACGRRVSSCGGDAVFAAVVAAGAASGVVLLLLALAAGSGVDAAERPRRRAGFSDVAAAAEEALCLPALEDLRLAERGGLLAAAGAGGPAAFAPLVSVAAVDGDAGLERSAPARFGGDGGARFAALAACGDLRGDLRTVAGALFAAAVLTADGFGLRCGWWCKTGQGERERECSACVSVSAARA